MGERTGRACTVFRQRYRDFGRTPLARPVFESAEYDTWIHHQIDCTSCSDWVLAKRVRSLGGRVRDYPCVHMAWHALQKCTDHRLMKRCPKAVILYDPQFDEYSIPDRNTSSLASTVISFCPWCGGKLPRSLRSQWFDELEKLGYQDPWGKDRKRLPIRFRASTWWLERRFRQ